MTRFEQLKSHKHRWFTWITYRGTRWVECRWFMKLSGLFSSLKISEPLRINWVFGCQNYLLELYVNLTREKNEREKFSFSVWYKKTTKLRHAGESDRTLPGCETQVISWSSHTVCSFPSLPLFLMLVLPSIRIKSLEKSGPNVTSVNFWAPCHSSLRAGIDEKPRLFVLWPVICPGWGSPHYQGSGLSGKNMAFVVRLVTWLQAKYSISLILIGKIEVMSIKEMWEL